MSNSISYLASQNLTHGSITCSSVLLTTEGVLKIGKCKVKLRGSLLMVTCS